MNGRSKNGNHQRALWNENVQFYGCFLSNEPILEAIVIIERPIRAYIVFIIKYILVTNWWGKRQRIQPTIYKKAELWTVSREDKAYYVGDPTWR